jgi:hypothetical protein
MDRDEAEEALALIRRVVNRVHDETILQNRGTVLVVTGVLGLLACSITQYLASAHLYGGIPYAITWGIYLALGLVVNLGVRTRLGGTMTYVERHVWGTGVTFYVATIALVALDCWFLDPARALQLIPAHAAVMAGVVFALMALIDLRFYFCTAALFLTAAALAFWPDYGFAVLGGVWFLCQGVPGVVYLRERKPAGAQTEVL